MKFAVRDKFYGQTVDEWAEKLPGELSTDAVGLWQIVAFGREGFGLNGEELVRFVRKGLSALFAKHVIPVTGSKDNVSVWVAADYAGTPEEISEKIISEWLSSGRDPTVGDVWFALPHVLKMKLASPN